MAGGEDEDIKSGGGDNGGGFFEFHDFCYFVWSAYLVLFFFIWNGGQVG